MANAIYPTYKRNLMTANTFVDLSSNVHVALVDTGTYTYSAAHEFLTDLTGIVANTTMASLAIYANGTFDAADVTFSAVSGASAEAIVLYKWVGTGSAASYLVAYIDTGVTGLPVTPSGGDITINWDAQGIFTL